MEPEEVRVEIGSQQFVVIEKLFGPAIFPALRVVPDVLRDGWVIYRQDIHETDDAPVLVEQEVSFIPVGNAGNG